MENNDITVSYGDKITVAPNPDGELAVKLQNTAFDEAARWLNVRMSGHDRLHAIDDLIDALKRLRDDDQ